MKLLILSDSHGSYDALERCVELERPDIIYHLGDYCSDGVRLGKRFFHIPSFVMAGNCDFRAQQPEQVVDEVERVRIFACHGHRYHVKSTLMALKLAAQEHNAALCLFGHTHIPFLDEAGGITFLNPGACSGRTPCYAVVDLSGGQISCSLKRLKYEEEY